ncbi:barren [Gloeophyllum trabeum ATCC 11539]|uniref:Condensin complex subunit 2 n=1 Tax=Gloeophyllum trabeum (strain ATCC 11539 / FP-39264 / Madison 617) TaxID=670483 RepID=S7RTJ1_GLOTA|nr:barren [Gloeophyllum trabeum ATCC 11539]EPQ56454.1 barren [Gloeophyllum trabeum ATCC 11539]
MAPTRTSRARAPQVPLFKDDTDSGDETEQETPRPQRQQLKKRLSEVYNPENDQSFTSDTGRGPLKSVNINDDMAEKRRRRKSTKGGLANGLLEEENAEAGPSSERHSGGAPAESSKAAGQGRQKQPLNSVTEVPTINVPLDVMSSNFEEWMKMATDNKINATNSWNFALIDYFHDMSLLRNNTDNSINFQRASCTLDGCVKIWTSRVDSVGTETGKLLSNLATDGRVEEEEEVNSDNPDQDPSQPRKRAKAHKAESTLAKNAAQLRSKKLDLEFSVDPLFKKTCADFDEGGAQGLLMNHLSLGVGSEGAMRVIFDASDSMGKTGEEEEDVQEPEDEVDLSYLRSQFLPDLDVLEDKAISHSLAGFSFSLDSFSFDDTAFGKLDTHAALGGAEDDDDDDHHGSGMTGGFADDVRMDIGDPGEEDFFQGEQAVGDDYLGDIPQDDFNDSGDGDAIPHEGGQGVPLRQGGFVPFDPRRAPNERDLIMAMTDAEGDGMMDYFDQAFLKNWAGPEHWKLRKVVRKPEATDNAAPKPRKEKKEAFKIDFLTPAEKDLKTRAKELFAPVTRGAGINLPGTSGTKGGTSTRKGSRGKRAKEKEEKKDEHTLPDDMHFSSRQLITLFLKPEFSLRMRGQHMSLNDRGDGDVDENFWAQAAADQAAGRRGADDADENGGAIPFNTQFFHDDFDDGPGFDDVYDGDGLGASSVEPGEQDLLAATQGQTRRVRPEAVNYAKRAKRVDVRKLKENIWKGLNIVVPDRKEDAEDEEAMEIDEDHHATDPSEPRVFSSVISDLRSSYPREKMEEISTSFCFICLLHLANERGLKLEVGKDGQIEPLPDDDEQTEALKVGDIWDLKVYRDPDASPAA